MVARRKSDVKVPDSVLLKEGTVTETEGNEKGKEASLFLYFAVITGSLTFIGGGGCLVWSSPVLPKLSSNNTDINPLGYPVTSYEVSLIVGSFAFGTFLAPLFTGKLMDGIGRKHTMIAFAALEAVFLIVLAFAKDIVWMTVARIITGIAVGVTMVVLSIFVPEIADDHNRGKFGCIMSMFPPLGQLYGYTIGTFLPVKYFTLTCAVPLILHALLILFFVPETPVYLLHKGRRQAAVKSLEKYRSNKSPSEIEKDISIMEYAAEQATKDHKGGFLSLFSHQTARRGLVIALGITTIQMGTGISVILSFMGPIFEQAQTGISGNVTSILVGSLKVVSFFFTSHVVERVGRKPLMFFSTIFCCVPLFLLGLYFFMKEHNFESYQSYSWLPVTSMLFFILSYSFGLGPIPMATVGELFPTHIRSTAVSFVLLFITITNIIIMSSFPILSDHIGIHGCMWIYSVLCALGAVFIYFVVPETKGKSVHEIQVLLKGDSMNSDEIFE